MATFKSGWMWQVVNRKNDLNVQNGIRYIRSNWSLIRYRVTDEIYTSQLDETASSLTAENGGVEEKINKPVVEISGLKFATDTVWTDTDTVWIDSGLRKNYQPVYRPLNLTPNAPDASQANVVMLLNRSSQSAIYYTWCACEVRPVDLAGGVFFDTSEEYTNNTWGSNAVNITDDGDLKAFDIDGKSLGGFTVGTFTATATVASTGLYEDPSLFICTADIQSYQQPSVEWYTQIQTWSYKDNWRIA